MTSREALVAELQGRGIVCPMPNPWNQLWNLISRGHGRDDRPPLPLILAAWWDASDAEKAERFACHLEWAEQHGTLSAAVKFLQALPDDDWYRG